MEWVTKSDLVRPGRKIDTPKLTATKNLLRLNIACKNIYTVAEEEYAMIGIDSKQLIIKFTDDKNKGLKIIRSGPGYSLTGKKIFELLDKFKWNVPFHVEVQFDKENLEWSAEKKNAKEYVPAVREKKIIENVENVG